MPLTAELYEPDEWGDMPEEAERLTGGELASYEDLSLIHIYKNGVRPAAPLGPALPGANAEAADVSVDFAADV